MTEDATSATDTPPGTYLFRDARIFDGIGRTLRSGHVLVENGTIREVSESPISAPDATVIPVGGRTLMPGLIDLHVHIWAADLDVVALSRQPTEYYSLFAARFVQTSLDHGFTTLRDAGGTDAGFARAIERGWLAAPRFFHSGRYISQTGGHGDFRASSDQGSSACECCPPPHERFSAIVDGPDAVRRAVREEFRRGARAVKIMASGGVASPSDPIDKLQFTDAEIRAAVEEAAMRGSYIFAHCHPDAAIRRASELGVRCIEHATFVTPETADVLARNGTYAVPTLAVVQALQDDGAALGLPEVSRQKLAGVLDAALESLTVLTRAGVKIGFGTDLLGAQHDRQGTEFLLRARMLPAHDILVSATSTAAEILGEQGRLGVVAPGAHADLIVVDGDPLTDIDLLSRRGRALPLIMKAGRLHKNVLAAA